MEAKETVMSDLELEGNIRKDYRDFRVKDETDYVAELLQWTREAQAEISFKAGEQLALEKQGRAYLEGKQAGQREVAECIEDCFIELTRIAYVLKDSNRSNALAVDALLNINRRWQAKLKEWGLKEE